MLGPLLLAILPAAQDYDLGKPFRMDYSEEIDKAQAQAEPLGALIEVVSGDGSTATGAGFVVGQTGAQLEILTSPELVRPTPTARYRVRLTGADDWVDVAPDTIRVLEAGLAFLRIPSAGAPFGAEVPLAQIVPAVTASARIDAPAFLLTVDSTGAPKWYEGRIRTHEEGVLGIRLPDAGPEVVGAAVMTRNFEYMGQVLARDQEMLTALHYEGVSKATETDDVVFGIELDRIHQTVVKALQGRYPATLVARSVSPRGRVYYHWYVVNIEAQDGLFFWGSIWGLNRRSAFQVYWSRDGLIFRFGYMDAPLRKAPEYRLAEEQPVEGFLAFEASMPRMQGWLVIPTSEDQLLGTLLHLSRTRYDGHSYLDRHARHTLTGFVGGPRIIEIDGREPRFPALIPFESEGPPVGMKLPSELVERGGRIEGFYGLTDIHQETRGRGRSRILAYELSFRDPTRDDPLGAFRFAEDAYRLPFEVKIPAGTSSLEWSMRGRRAGPGLAVLEMAVVRFD